MNDQPRDKVGEQPPISKATPGVDLGERPHPPGPRDLFELVCFALCNGQLRLKPRERQLCLALALWSFGEGRDYGIMDLDRLRGHLGEEWRRNEVRKILERWGRAGWLSVDGAFYRLAPDNLPGWPDCFKDGSGDKTPGLAGLSSPENHLGTLVSQERALALAAKISQRANCENFAVLSRHQSEPGKTGPPVLHCENFAVAPNVNVRTFNRSQAERKNVSETLTLDDCENFAVQLRRRVRAFVGESDWNTHWEGRQQWRRHLFDPRHEGRLLEQTLNGVEAGLKDGTLTVKKTRGKMLWGYFQEERQATK